jgi:hypothetical protein
MTGAEIFRPITALYLSVKKIATQGFSKLLGGKMQEVKENYKIRACFVYPEKENSILFQTIYAVMHYFF